MKYNMISKAGKALLAFLLSLAVLPLYASSVQAEETEIGEDAELLNADIPNTEAYFPDANFRDYLSAYVDENRDGILSQAERDAETGIHANGRGIKNFKGIEYFPKITVLWCDTSNGLTELDLFKNTKLKTLHVFSTSLKTLDLTMCPDLEELWCFNCSDLLYVDLTKCTKLKQLHTYHCKKMSVLNLTYNSILISTYTYGTQSVPSDYTDTVRYQEAGGDLWIDPSVAVKTKLAPPTSIKINDGNVNLGYEPYMGLPGGWDVLTYTIKPANAAENSVIWYASDESIVTVDQEGMIAAQKAGTAQIKVRVTAELSDTITVTVQERPLIHKFVARLYMIALDRPADMTGFQNWVDKLTNKKITAAEAVRGFFLSAEMTKKNLSDSEFVERCYKVMFDRASDPKGKNGWLEKLNNGVSRTFVIKGFIDSTEFANTCKKFGVTKGTINVTEARDQNYGITSFVARCYVYVLERKFDIKGLNDWCSKILTSANKKQTAINMASNGFYHSPEYLKKNTSNAKYLTSLYWTFLGRKPDTAGYNDWLNKLNSGTSRDTVLYGFANSQEFANLMASYGIK